MDMILLNSCQLGAWKLGREVRTRGAWRPWLGFCMANVKVEGMWWCVGE